MNLDSRQTEAFLAVLHSGSFEAAAPLLHISASAVSQRIRALETALGQPLLLRTRPCQATAKGRELARYLRQRDWLDQEFAQTWTGADAQPQRLVLVSNFDSLDTWLVGVLAQVLADKPIDIEVLGDDQEHTRDWLESGLAMAALTAQAAPMRGCSAHYLGAMRYRLVASRAFFARHFGAAVDQETLSRAPLLVFNRKDRLQYEFLQRRFRLPESRCRVRFVPATHAFWLAVQQGLGYGMIPDIQGAVALQTGDLVDLAPGDFAEVPLYWQTWQLHSPLLQHFTQALVAAAGECLQAFED